MFPLEDVKCKYFFIYLKALTKAYQMDKENYLKQFEQFKSTPEGQELLENEKKKNEKKAVEKAGKTEKAEKKLKNKSKNQLAKLETEMGKPKRYPLAINLFASEQMKEMTGPITERIKVISEKWKNMSQKQKDPFVKKSDELKAIYEKELAQYEEKLGKEGLSKLKEKAEAKAVEKRNPSAYNLFASEQMKGMTGPVSERMKVVAEKWRNMSQEQKAPFIKKSDELKTK